jgi:LPXTG-motif cell wall-anchored protein
LSGQREERDEEVGQMSRRRAAAFLMMTALAALGLSFASASGASAQTLPPATSICEYTVSPVTLTPPGGTVTVQGVAPPGVTVNVFADGNLIIQTTADPVTGAFFVQFFLAHNAFVQVTVNAYPPTECNPSAEQAEIIARAEAAARAAALPHTGGSNLETKVLVGLVMLVVGAALMVAVRRRDTLGDSPRQS